MTDVVYSVEIQLAARGSLDGSLGGLGVKARALDSAFKDVGSSIAGMGAKIGGVVGGIVDQVESVAMGFAKWGVIAAAGAAVYGVGKLNDQLEQTNLSLAAIFNAQGFTGGNFDKALTMANDQLSKMKQQVKTLPGDLGQLSDIMKTIATPAAMGGANPDTIRELAGRSMLVGRILGVQQDVVAREMANLLSGRAGAHNILGLRMGLAGDAAKEFNAKSAQGRLEDIQKRFSSYAPAAESFSHTFIANWTTLLDNIKYTLLAPATSPLFEGVKSSIIEANKYMDDHKDRIAVIVSMVGNRLQSAWAGLEEIFKRVAPLLARIGDSVLNMSGADIAEKLKYVAELGLAAKFLGPAISGGTKLIGMAAGGITAEAGAGAALGAGALGAAMVPVSIMAVGAAAVATMAAFGQAHALVDKDSPYHKDAILAAKNFGLGVKEATEATKPVVSWFDKLGVSITDFTGTLLRAGAEFFQGWRALPSRFMVPEPDRSNYLPPDQAMGPIAALGLARLGEGIKGDFWEKAGQAVATGAKKGAGGGGGGTTIHKVEINVSSNQDPSQIARVVEARLSELARHPRSSRSTTNWSASR